MGQPHCLFSNSKDKIGCLIDLTVFVGAENCVCVSVCGGGGGCID